MFEEINSIFWIDIKNIGEGRDTTLTKLFQHVAHLGIPIKDNGDFTNIISVNLEDENIKVKDWYGWTQLLGIEKYINQKSTVSKISIKDSGECLQPNESVLYVDNNYLLPIFSEESIKRPSRGFHGEVIYKSTLKLAKNIGSDDMMRFSKKPEQFCHLINGCAVGASVFYKIRTRSGMFNCSNFHVMDNYRIETETE